MSITKAFARFASGVSRIAGRGVTFVACIALVVAWAVSGPMFGFSDTWQLVINTGTTVITFLMVFVIQNTQNRDNAALQAKLDELIRFSEAENRFIGIEKLSDKELEDILEEVEAGAVEKAETGRKSASPKPRKRAAAPRPHPRKRA